MVCANNATLIATILLGSGIFGSPGGCFCCVFSVFFPLVGVVCYGHTCSASSLVKYLRRTRGLRCLSPEVARFPQCEFVIFQTLCSLSFQLRTLSCPKRHSNISWWVFPAPERCCWVPFFHPFFCDGNKLSAFWLLFETNPHIPFTCPSITIAKIKYSKCIYAQRNI